VTLGDVRAGEADLQGRDVVTRGQRRSGHDHRSVSKRTGANLIETVDGVKKAVEMLQADLAGRRRDVLHPGQVEDHPPDAGRTCRTRSRPASCWSS
jgi:hypothetical protein